MAKYKIGYTFVRGFEAWRVREVREDGKYVVEKVWLDSESKYKSSTVFKEGEVEACTRTVDELREILGSKTACVSCAKTLGGVHAYRYDNNKSTHCGKTKDGRLSCQYCSEPIDEGDLHKSVIISRNWASNNYRSPERDYHKAKGCAAYDQMAHEG